MPSADPFRPRLHHRALNTTFAGSVHRLSTPEAQLHQYLGVKYASIPARFRQSQFSKAGDYETVTDASKHGPICPQHRAHRAPEELLFGIPQDEIPVQDLKQDEFECLNLNITCPADLTPQSRLPVMLWVHGGGDRGSGSEWFYDGGALVHRSMLTDKPVIFVTFNFRIGLLGFATSNIIRDDNKAAGEEGTGNYGLRDQRKALEWLHHNILEFGGDPSNITLIGSGSGAADIVCHLLSRLNASKPLFARAIVQSPVFEPTLPDVSAAGWHLSRVMSSLQVSSIDKFRKIEVEKLLGLGQTLRAVDDGVWFRDGWQSWFQPKESSHEQHHHRDQHLACHERRTGRPLGVSSVVYGLGVGMRTRSRSAVRKLRSPSRTPASPTLSHSGSHASVSAFFNEKHDLPIQPLIIGDAASDSLLWSLPLSYWNSAGIVRRLKAICQSLSKTSGVLRAYDINSYTPEEDILQHVLDLVDDARIAWPTHVLAESIRRDAEERGLPQRVWRYVFDQEGPARGMPHHAADLMYLFDWKPSSLEVPTINIDSGDGISPSLAPWYYDGPYDVDDEHEEVEKAVVSHAPPSIGSMDLEAALAVAAAAANSLQAPKIDPHALAHSIIHSAATGATPAAVTPLKPASSSTSSSSCDVSPASSGTDSPSEWVVCPVDAYTYTRVRDTLQSKWLTFAYGDAPWTAWAGNAQTATHPQLEKVFVFGPEGETGERSGAIFDGRRRRQVWEEVLGPLGWSLVMKVGVELSRGPSAGADRAR